MSHDRAAAAKARPEALASLKATQAALHASVTLAGQMLRLARERAEETGRQLDVLEAMCDGMERLSSCHGTLVRAAGALLEDDTGLDPAPCDL